MIQIQKQTWSKRTLYLLITDGGSVQLDIYTQPQGEYGIGAFIHNLWVQPYCRREGKAKELLDKAETIAHNSGFSAVYLEWEAADTPTWMPQRHARHDLADHAILRRVAGNPDLRPKMIIK